MKSPLSTESNQLLADILSLSAPGERKALGLQPQEAEQHTFAYITNPDGSPRWVFPAAGNSTRFLDLYQRSSLKAKVYHTIVKLGASVGLRAMLVSGKFSFSTQENKLSDLCKNMGYTDYAVFTGTAGLDRKSVVALGTGKHTACFLKIAHTKTALELVQHEADTLRKLRKYSFSTLRFPNLIETPYGHVIAQENARPAGAIQSKIISPLHLASLQELGAEMQAKEPSSTPSIQKAKKQVTSLSNSHLDTKPIGALLPKDFISKLQQLEADIFTQPTVQDSLSHGDFTPWNMYLTSEHIHLFDWERSAQRPLLFDLFHFIYQTEILLQKTGAKGIKNRIAEILPSLETMFPNIDIQLYHRCYLYLQIADSLSRYAEQDSLLLQTSWMLEAWNEMLNRLLNISPS